MTYIKLCGIVNLKWPLRFRRGLIAFDHKRNEVTLMNLNVLATFIFGSFTELLIFVWSGLHRKQGIGINNLCIIGLAVLSTFTAALTFAEVSGNRIVMNLFGTAIAYLFGFVTRSLVITTKQKAS